MKSVYMLNYQQGSLKPNVCVLLEIVHASIVPLNNIDADLMWFTRLQEGKRKKETNSKATLISGDVRIINA